MQGQRTHTQKQTTAGALLSMPSWVLYRSRLIWFPHNASQCLSGCAGFPWISPQCLHWNKARKGQSCRYFDVDVCCWWCLLCLVAGVRRKREPCWSLASCFRKCYCVNLETVLSAAWNTGCSSLFERLIPGYDESLKCAFLCFLPREKYKSYRCGTPSLEDHRRGFISNNWTLYG